MSEWISVKDRLPGIGNYICFNGGCVSSSRYYPPELYPEMSEPGRSYNGWTDMNRVTHWMPLPEKPTEDEA